jgi:hypothetical protein
LFIKLKVARAVFEVNQRSARANFAGGLGAIETFFSHLEIFKLPAGHPAIFR